MVPVECVSEDVNPVVEAVGMWESQRDFQRVWKAWEAGIMAFHAFHTLSFPWPAFHPEMLDERLNHPAEIAALAVKCVS